MKFSPNTTSLAILLAMAVANNVSGAEAELIEPLRLSVKQAISEFDRIDEARKKALKETAQFTPERMAARKPANLTFICTHNSRRSHLSQLWAQTAAIYYGLPNVT